MTAQRRSTLFVVLLGLILTTAISALAGTKLYRGYVITGMPMPKMKKILVIGAIENYLIRQAFEDEMKKALAKEGVNGIESIMVLPPRNEMMEGELKQRIKDADLDGVLIVRPKSKRTEMQEVVTGAVYVTPPGYYSFWPYWNTVYADVYTTSSYMKENVIVRAEFNLYNTKDEKLVWSGASDTLYSTDFEKLGKEYAKALVSQLKKDKVITKK